MSSTVSSLRRAACVLLLCAVAAPVAAQPVAPPGPAPSADGPSARKALALSLVLPGLGHRYVHGGDWNGTATLFALTDAALWSGLLGAQWNRDRLTGSYETLAATRADAVIDGKSRTFFLNLATYRTSDEYREVALRNRAWDQVDYVDDPAYQWAWASESDFLKYRQLRDDAESLGRRRSALVAVLVANRLIAGFSAVRSARRAQDAPDLTLSLSPSRTNAPWVHLGLRF